MAIFDFADDAALRVHQTRGSAGAGLLGQVCWVRFAGSGLLGQVYWVRFAGSGLLGQVCNVRFAG